MPARDPYNIEPGLNRTMCPHCGEDAHFVLPATWNLRSYEGWEEDRFQKFMRHSKHDDGDGHESRSRNLKLNLQDDTQIQCGACKNTFTYLDGRQAYVDQEQESIESSIVPSSEPIPEPTLYTDDYDTSRLYIPIAAYDFIHEGGIGNRGVTAHTSIIKLFLPLNAGAEGRWLIDLPDIESSRSRHGTPSEIKIDHVDNVPVPVSIPPEDLMQIVRNLYQHHAYAESYKSPEESVVYAKRQDYSGRDPDPGITISMEEANQIVGILKYIYSLGHIATTIKKSLSSNFFPFQIVVDLNGNPILQVPTKAGRIHKTIARELGITNLVELGGGQPTWNWQKAARKRPDVLNFHGAIPYYSDS